MEKDERIAFSKSQIDDIEKTIDSAFGKYISVKNIKATQIINKEAEIIVTLSYTDDDEFTLSFPDVSLRKLIKKGTEFDDKEIVIKNVPSHLKMNFRTYDDTLSFSLSYRQLRKLRSVINKILGSESDGR